MRSAVLIELDYLHSADQHIFVSTKVSCTECISASAQNKCCKALLQGRMVLLMPQKSVQMLVFKPIT